MRHATTGDLDQLTRFGGEEADAPVVRDVQANARAVTERFIGGDEAELRQRFETTDTDQGIAQNPDFLRQLRGVVQDHQITAPAASLDRADGLHSVRTGLE